MNETMRQRVWLVVVLVLAVLNVWQYVTAGNLRFEVERSRTEAGVARKEVDERARRLVANTLHERRHEMIAAGQWLDEFYRSDRGLKRAQGLWIGGRPDFEGIAAWLFDIYLAERFAGASEDQARQKVVEAIRRTDEWRQKHP